MSGLFLDVKCADSDVSASISHNLAVVTLSLLSFEVWWFQFVLFYPLHCPSCLALYSLLKEKGSYLYYKAFFLSHKQMCLIAIPYSKFLTNCYNNMYFPKFTDIFILCLLQDEVRINYNKLHADPKQGKTLDLSNCYFLYLDYHNHPITVLKKVKHRIVETMESSTADALGLSRAILVNGLLDNFFISGKS